MSTEKSSIITIKELKKTFGTGDKANEVLKGINLEIYPGQIIGYIGPNGAGKSTTVKILTGILTGFEGNIKVLGFDLKKDSLEIKKQIGYVPENGAMYDLLTPNEYLSFIGNLYEMKEELIKSRTEHLLSFFEMEKHADQRMDTFSKGMKQKILIMAGIINNPKILFLDEPLSGLDANSVILVKEILIKMAKSGTTIFYCSHLMDIVEKISDRIILINNGNVIADGKFEDLKTEQSESLEQLFAQLTGKENTEENTNSLFEVFEN